MLFVDLLIVDLCMWFVDLFIDCCAEYTHIQQGIRIQG